MSERTYPAAHLAASRVQPHFARHLASAREKGRSDVAPEPSIEVIGEIINAAFWASLRREEGYVPTISLAYVPPARAGAALSLARPIPLASEFLARVSPAVERPGIHLGVWPDEDGLCVWGSTHMLPAFCFVLEVIAPGLLVVKHSRGDQAAKFINVAVLEGDQIKVLDQNAATTPDCVPLITSLFGSEPPGAAAEPLNVHVQLAISMRAHRRGGSLLVVPAGSEAWQDSIVHPIRYAISPAFSELADLIREGSGERQQRRWQESVRRSVDAIAGLTAVDGATIMTDQFELLGFGAKIGRREGCAQVDQVLLTEPVEGAEPQVVSPGQLGGTRHLSAAQFVQDQRDALALIASQDGRFTVFAWSPCMEMVHAHRVESLLL